MGYHAKLLISREQRSQVDELIEQAESVPTKTPGFFTRKVKLAGGWEAEFTVLECQVCRVMDPVHFMVERELWVGVADKLPSGSRSFVCIECFESILGRMLEETDLTMAPVNMTLRKMRGWAAM